jgi:GNAT superfamily N-acetyltransferase
MALRDRHRNFNRLGRAMNKSIQAAIRAATKDDVLAVLELQQQWHEEDITWGFVPDTFDGMSGYLGEYFFVATVQKKVIGFTTGEVEPTPSWAASPSNEPCLEVIDLYVSPPFRSNGVGGLLLQSLLDQAKAEGIRSFKLHSGTKDTTRITSFYGRFGFKVVGVEMTMEAKNG